MKQRCHCLCHSLLGDAAELRHWGRIASARVLENEVAERSDGVDVHDHVACVLACDPCRKFHAAVLQSPPKGEKPWDDNNPPKPASGCEGEGAE